MSVGTVSRQIVRRPISKLSLDPENANKHNESSIAAISASLAKFGQQTPVVVDANGIVLKGNGTMMAALRLGWAELDVIESSLDGEAARAYAIADNRSAEFSEWNLERLVAQLESFEASYRNSTGFDAKDLTKLQADLKAQLARTGKTADELVEDEPPDLPTHAKSQPGVVYQLGRHRLVCGDVTDSKIFSSLMRDDLASMALSDPPYNVNYKGSGKANRKAIANDNLSGDKFEEFLRRLFEHMNQALLPGSTAYVFHADVEGERFRRMFGLCGFKFAQCLIWEKSAFVMGRNDYHYKHEPCMYGWKLGAGHRYYGNRKQSTMLKSGSGIDVQPLPDGRFKICATTAAGYVELIVPSYEVAGSLGEERTTIWRFERPTKSKEHPTMKPIKLCGRAIEHGSRPGEFVFDPTAGSGSTLIACEHLGRNCLTAELDPAYCDVIIERWRAITGGVVTEL